MIEPQLAATVMVARESAAGIEFFLLRRSSRSAFMPDVYVFPGGRVEPQDATPAAHERMTGRASSVDPAYVHAAARETFEECGLLFADAAVDVARLTALRARLLAGTIAFTPLLAELGVRVDAGALHYFSRWVTPAGEPRRYDTHFFVGRAPAGQAALADAVETHDGIWIAPDDALARAAAGTLALIFPTVKHLERVRAYRSIDDLLAFAERKPKQLVLPELAAGTIVIPRALEGVW